MEKDYRWGVVVGRFQVDELTIAHRTLLKHVTDRHFNVIVFIGDRNSPSTTRDPLSFKVRRQMIISECPFALVLRLLDEPNDDAWSRNLDQIIDREVGLSSAVLYAGRDGFIPYYTTKKYNTVELDLGLTEVSGSARRKEIGKNAINLKEFRAGIIYAIENLWHRTFHTVDMAILRDAWWNISDGDNNKCWIEILIGRKPHESLWRLPGGFVDKGETFAEAAERETKEETGLMIKVWKYIDDVLIPDWRVKDIDGVDHKTVLMRTWYYGKDQPVAGDDLEEVKWVNFDDLNRYEFIPSHKDLLFRLRNHLMGE